jgi:hypothetical protein
VVLGLEVAAGGAAAWVWRKARRVGGVLDQDVDAAVNGALERVDALVAGKLDGDWAFARLECQAAGDPWGLAVAARTWQRVELAVADGAEADERFARRLAVVIEAVRQAERVSGMTVPTMVAASGGRSVAVGGNNSGAITAGEIGAEGRRP